MLLDEERDISQRLDEEISKLGVVPGSTVHFRKHP